jgi:putative PIN family toxin of toxin-antitoxin system
MMAAHVIDTNVLVAALRSKTGASRQLLLAALNRRIEVVVSVPLLLEYESVLKRPVHLEAMALSIEDIDTFLSDLGGVAREVGLVYRWRSNIKDPKDDMVIETAINGGARSIITFNVQHFVPAAERFGIRVARPVEILRVLRRNTHENK